MKKYPLLIIIPLFFFNSLAQQRFTFDSETEISLRQKKLYTKYIDSTLLNLEQVNNTFNFAKDSTGIDFNYVFESKDKAHAISILLDYKKIKHYKIWNFNPKKISYLLESQKLRIVDRMSKDTINKDYHVAILLYVKNKGAIEPMVLDPAISNTVVTVKQWLFLQNAPQSYYTIIDSKWCNFETLHSLISHDKKKYTFPKGMKQNLSGGFILYKGNKALEESLAAQQLGIKILKNIVNKTTNSHKKIVFTNLVKDFDKLLLALRNKKTDKVLKPYIPLLKSYQDKYASLKNRWEQKFVMLKYGETPIDPNLAPPPVIENKK